jgi:hypothetical protein
MTQMGAALSALLSGPLGAVIANLERANALRSAQSSNDPVLQDLLRQRNETGRPAIFGGGFDNAPSQLEIDDQIVQRTRELANERANAVKEIEKSNELDLTSLNLLEAQIALEKVNGDLTNAAVFALEEKLIRRQAEVDLQAAGNDQTKIETALLKEQLSLVQLRNRAQAARDKAAESAARTAASAAKAAEAEQKRIAILQAQLNTSTALLAIDKQIAAAQVDGDKAKLAELEFTRALEASELKIAEIRARGAGEAETQLQIQREELRLEDELVKLDTKHALARKDLAKSFQATIDGLTIELGLAQAVTREEENRLKLQQKRLALEGKGLDDNEVNQIINLQQQLQEAQAPLAQYFTQTQRWLSDTESQIVSLAQSIETSISGAMAGAVEAMVTGSKTVQEVLSEMFAQIGRAFLNMAAEIIAKQLVMITLQSILKALGAVGGGGGGDTFSQGLSIDGTLAGGGIFSGSGPYGFAEGGYVTGPTNALIGEAGESEYVIPASKMASAMANYRAGKRGSSVIEDSSGAEASSEGGNNTFTLETVVINKVEYATVAQVREMGAAAAKQGAQGGYTKTMSSMRNSRATRARLGMG